MKRLHVSLGVSDLDQSIGFYATLFGRPPTVLKPDYAKWMLDDPLVNFSISTRSSRMGVDHLGIQVDNDGDLADIAGRLEQAGRAVFRQEQAKCCYFQSNKAWVRDPQDVAWETFHTTDTNEVYGEDVQMAAELTEPAAVAPLAASVKACCAPAAS